MTVGEIVAEDFKYARVFDKYRIDFCCNGSIPLSEACKYAQADMDEVVRELETSPSEAFPSETSPMMDFKTWPIDLLVDYILKFHHRNIRTQGPKIAALLDKVCRVHGDNHPKLFEVQELFQQSLSDLDNHLQKEEMVLFPYIYGLCEATDNHAPAPHFHCGTIESPIAVMMAEHDAEGERYRHIARLTNDYTAPADACGSYHLVLDQLKAFEAALHHHIHLENNIVFPRSIMMESGLCSDR